MGFAALLERSDDPDELRRYATKIRLGMAQVDGIVREMLAFAREPSRDDDRGAAVGDRAARAATAVPACRMARIGVDTDPDLPVGGSALTRVLANLFRNSAEASEVPVTIRVAATVSAERVELRVTDDGPGVDAGLGDARVRAVRVVQRPRPRTGLGACVARHELPRWFARADQPR